jgi:hypothetical protein
MGVTSRVLWNNAPNSASIADAITLVMMELILWMAPLYAGGGGIGTRRLHGIGWFYT